MNSFDILVIILAVALFVSLIVWILVGVLFMQVMRKVREASDVARVAAENVEEFTASLRNAGKATAVGSIIAQVTRAFKGRK